MSTSRRPAPKPDRRRLRHFALEPLESRALLSLGTVAPATEITGKSDIAGSVAVGSMPSGVTPQQMRTAYNIAYLAYYQRFSNGSGYNTLSGTGAGQTIAIVDPYNEPTLMTKDLAAFDTQFGLSAPPSFQIVNENGQSSPLPGQGTAQEGEEEALDVEWAHAIAPQANIVLVEASSFNSIFTAINTARNIPGVSVVSMSFNLYFNTNDVEDPTEVNGDPYFTTPSGSNGVTFVASSGDYGTYVPGTSTVSVNYPAASPNVVSVGGTNLTIGANNSYGGETAWGNGTSSGTLGGSGGGISRYEAHPSYQNGVEPSTTNRAVPDVSMAGGPTSQVAIYDSTDFGSSGPWGTAYGTSLSAPMWAGLISIADQFRSAAGEAPLTSSTALQAIYSIPPTDYFDVTSGSNGVTSGGAANNAGVGYDTVTGRGSPFAQLLVNDMVSTSNSLALTGELAPGHVITTPNGLYVLIMQAGDGNLVEYGPDNEVVWASNTGSTQNAGAYVVMQPQDGNLVIYLNNINPNLPASVLWASNTSNFQTNANATLNITYNGTMTINRTNGAEVWVANTYLAPGRTFYPGQDLYSPNYAYVLTMQDDGNLVLYTNTNPATPVWSSNTGGHPGAFAVMQTDGNFVIYLGSAPLFATNTSGHNGEGVQLEVLNSGQLVLILNGQVIWTS